MWGAEVLGGAIMEMENVIPDGDTKPKVRLWAGEPLSLLSSWSRYSHFPLPRTPSHPQNTSKSNRSVADLNK